jgi:hypothetical protein
MIVVIVAVKNSSYLFIKTLYSACFNIYYIFIYILYISWFIFVFNSLFVLKHSVFLPSYYLQYND